MNEQPIIDKAVDMARDSVILLISATRAFKGSGSYTPDVNEMIKDGLIILRDNIRSFLDQTDQNREYAENAFSEVLGLINSLEGEL